MVIRCQKQRKNRATQVQMTFNSDVLKLFDKRMKERGEKNRSQLTEDLMVCWIYRDPKTGECLPDCPQYEAEADGKKS